MDPKPLSFDRVLYTIGHSNHTLETFIELLRARRIEVLVDSRSSPYSKYVPHFNREALKAALTASGVRYLDLGRELGGRPVGDEYYDEEDRVYYDRLAESETFLEGIGRLESGLRQYRVAVMCSEEDPRVCHRHLLVARVMVARGVPVVHIRGDGRTEAYAECLPAHRQPSLFDDPPEAAEWKSLRSVSRRKAPSNSSDSSADMASADWSMSD